MKCRINLLIAHQVIDRTYWYDEESGDDAWEWYEDYDEEEDLATQVSDQELQGTVNPPQSSLIQ